MPSSQPESSCQATGLQDSRLYINRETAWLQFNCRVLEEALNADNPLLERVKFLSIFATNLDEFFMIRVSGLSRQVTGGVLEAPPDGMTPLEQLAAIRKTLVGHLEQALNCWHQDLAPKLRDSGVPVLSMSELGHRQKAWLRRYFAREIFPALTPLAFDPAHPFPHISNLSFNLAVVVSDPQSGERFARVKISDVAPTLVRLPNEADLEANPDTAVGEVKASNFVPVEEVVAANLDMLFPGIDVMAAYPFRITRDADLEIKDDEASDLLTSVEAQIEMRHWGSVVRLEIDRNMPERIRNVLIRNLELEPFQVYTIDGPLNLAGLMELTRVDRADLKDQPYLPVIAPPLVKRERLFETIRRQDMLLYHPYDSFVPVIDFIREAASDPDVLAIKQTLYRVGPNSPIVAALMEARENQKQVAVLLELKARFDEENNIAWARALEDEGVHVIYGVLGLKTHAKMCLVVRREPDGIRCYVHMGTGNYNPVTSRIYTDLSYFTCNPRHQRRRVRPVQRPDRVLRQGNLPPPAGGAAHHAAADHRAHRTRNGPPPGARRRLHRLQDERPGGYPMHPGPVPRLTGWRHHRPAGTRHLLPVSGRAGGERDDYGDLDRGALSRTRAHLLFPQRRRLRGVPGQRRPDAAQPGPARRDAVPGDAVAAARRHHPRHPGGASAGYEADTTTADRWPIRAPGRVPRDGCFQFAGMADATLAGQRSGA